jgi:WXXGXW repeat (2 copies)
MKSTQLPTPIVVTSWLATVILTVVGFTCGAQRLLIAQQPASPGTVAGTSSANLNPTAAANVSQSEPNLQVLMQGAVHEAFGQPVMFNPAPNPVIPNQPPASVEEMPPSMRPAGNNVQWIPGYWSWEAIQQKFVWTSGIWRVIPPGLAWVPGYWMQSGTGYQWVSGFWNRSGTATALASFSQQMGGNGLVSPFATAPANPAAASSLAPTSTPTLPPGVTPIANPTGVPGTDPSVVFPPPAASQAIPAGSTAAPVAAAGGPPILGAVPGPNPSTPIPLPGTTLPDTALPGTALPGTALPDATLPGTTLPGTTLPATTPALTLSGANPAALGTNPVGAPDLTATTGVNPTANAANAGVANPVPIDPIATAASGSPFVPRPPASLESGPVGNPPTPDFTWIPGTWIYRHGRFLWLAGQWSPIRRGWVWIPARYVWTPAGYIFVDGFWDYELAQRGVLFAPVSFRRGFHGWGFTYTPSVVLNTRRLTEFLFVNSPCGCYCFGDYYGANCVQAGIFPWFAFHMSSLGYDPCFAFSSWAHHRDAGWHERLITDFRAFRDDARLRPPRTLDDLARRGGRKDGKSEPLALPLGKFAARTGPSSTRFESLSGVEHGEIERSLHRWREAASRRLELETKSPKYEPMKSHKKHPKIADSRSESKIAESKRESKIADDRREGKTDHHVPVSQPADLYLHNPRGALVDRSTTRTPPVVARRPVSTAELGQSGIHETPDQRLANPKFVPQASNRGRSQPVQKADAIRRK